MNRLCVFALSISAALALAPVSSRGQSVDPVVIGEGGPVLPPLIPAAPSVPPPVPIPLPEDRPSSGKLLNLSTRGWVEGTAKPLIAGIVVSPGNRAVLVRAVGPTLGAFGVPSTLARPTIELRNGQGDVVATGVAWNNLTGLTQTRMSTTAQRVGAFALNAGAADAVLFVYLDAGSYTCVVTGAGETSGTVLLECYDVPPLPVTPSM